MPNITFAVPDEVRREMRLHDDVKWTEILRRAIRDELDRLHLYDRLLQDSQLTEEDAVELGRKIRRAASRRRGG